MMFIVCRRAAGTRELKYCKAPEIKACPGTWREGGGCPREQMLLRTLRCLTYCINILSWRLLRWARGFLKSEIHHSDICGYCTQQTIVKDSLCLAVNLINSEAEVQTVVGQCQSGALGFGCTFPATRWYIVCLCQEQQLGPHTRRGTRRPQLQLYLNIFNNWILRKGHQPSRWGIQRKAVAY